MKKIISIVCLFSLGLASAQNTNLSSSQIYHALQKLNTVGSVLYIAAHPDDENTRLLAYLANEKKLRTGYLSITRGDGGQNLIGKEQGEALGLIRTQELLAARRIDGAEQFFTRANDFGFSKNPEETFTFWNKDSILYDVVFRIRKFKPDVIICRFPTTGEGGHGHHTASAILAQEAFAAAADPKKFPDQLLYTQVWQARRLYWNTFNFGTTNTTSPDQLNIDVGLYNELLGAGYGEIASESRSMHKSQGFGTAKQRGTQLEYFKILKGDTAKKDLHENIETNWNRIEGGKAIATELDQILHDYSISNPENSVKALCSVYKKINDLNENEPYNKYWKDSKLNETKKLILACSGFFAEALASNQVIVPGDVLTYSIQMINRSNVPIELKGIKLINNADTITKMTFKNNTPVQFVRKDLVANNTPYSEPYWLKGDHQIGSYPSPAANLQGQAENDPVLRVRFTFNIEGLEFTIDKKVEFKLGDPVKGEIYKPLQLLPALTINASTKNLIFTDTKSRTLNIVLKANKDGLKCDVRPVTPEGWSFKVSPANIDLAHKGDEAIVNLELIPGPKAANGALMLDVFANETKYTQGIKRLEYDHIPTQFFLEDAVVQLSRIDLKKGGIQIGYIPGAGDDVAECLRLAGYEVTLLSDEQLKLGQLSQYNAIITGIRAYNTNEKLNLYKEQLMAYVKNGGNFLVQYNTNSRVGPLQAGIGPYPFTISRERVTNEKAEVSFKTPQHLVLQKPNVISPKDFEGWIQERGIYFATELDKQYETILLMNDPNEKVQDGSLIIGKYGKGNFVYTGLAFFRQLPAGVGGAYRLMANLLALPKN